jgi:hypothetical protein
MEKRIKLFAVLLVCGLVASVSAAPVINPSVQTRPIVCRYWLTSWLCSDTGNSGGGTYQVVMDSSTESTVNIWNFTTDLMNWTSTTTNVYYGQGMNQTPNQTAGSPGLNGSDGDDATVAINYTFTLGVGEDATVVNIGTPSDVLLDIGIPTGPQGTPGTPGTPGSPGAANMTAGPPGEQGPPGAANTTAGPAGLAATIDVNYTFTGSPASVTNVGTTAAALLDFVVPSGDSYNASYWTGTNYNVTYLTSSFNSTYDAFTNYNVSYWTGTNYNVSYLTSSFNSTYDAFTNYNASYWTGTNYNASYLISSFNSTYAAFTNYNLTYHNKANQTQYAYVTLMSGSAMIPTTSPPSNFDQQETTTNKNNFIYANISNAAGQNVQWIVDMPADWDGGNIIANFLWSVQSGSGNVNWTLSGLRFDNDAAIDAALPLISFKVDTVITAGDLHVSDATTAAAITGAGNVVIFKVGRSSTDDTLAAVPGQLIGVRLKYAKAIGAT